MCQHHLLLRGGCHSHRRARTTGSLNIFWRLGVGGRGGRSSFPLHPLSLEATTLEGEPLAVTVECEEINPGFAHSHTCIKFLCRNFKKHLVLEEGKREGQPIATTPITMTAFTSFNTILHREQMHQSAPVEARNGRCFAQTDI